MDNLQATSGPNGHGGGPKTKAGKERSRLNALKHGGYSKSLTSRSGPLREKAALRRTFYASFERDFKPEDTTETNCVNSMADWLCCKASALGWEEVRIREEIVAAAAPYKNRERWLEYYRHEIALHNDDLARLESEKTIGLNWDPGNSLRTEYLTLYIKQNKSRTAAWEFGRLSTAEGRKEYFYRTLKWTEQALWQHMTEHMQNVLEWCLRREQIAAEKKDILIQSGRMDLEIARSYYLSPDEVDQIMSIVARCDRQIEKAVEFLMKYRAAKMELKARERSSGNLPEASGAGAQAA